MFWKHVVNFYLWAQLTLALLFTGVKERQDFQNSLCHSKKNLLKKHKKFDCSPVCHLLARFQSGVAWIYCAE